VSKPKPNTEQKIKKAVKAEADAVKVDASAQKLAKILKRAKGSGNNK
jgi:hypothetical protein